MLFTNPFALLLLVLLPAVAALGWPSRGSGRRRETLSLAVRLVILLCLVLALAGFSVVRAARDLAVVFLIDVSDSLPEQAFAAALDYTRRALAEMGPDDQAAVIAFGGDALVERPMSPGHSQPPLSELASIPDTHATDLAEAMRLALALYPPGAARRMVILSDGADTVSREDPAVLLDTARLAAASGVDLLVLPLVSEPGPEVLVAGVQVPGHLRQGEAFDLRLTLQAAGPAEPGSAVPVDLRVFAGDRVVYEGVQQVERGVRSFSLPLIAGEPGFTRYRVQITAPQDGFYQNNELAAYTQVEGPPEILVVAPPPGEPLGPAGEPRPDESRALVSALRAAGYVVETARPAELPSNLAELAGWSALVLVDAPARELSQRQMQALQSYVRDLGGGLTAVGGPTSFGVGGYFRTPLEDTLPLEMQIKDEQRRPSLTMIFIIDHSGSMADTSGGAAKLELAKEAAIRSVELLSPLDRVGVIAFDETASWVVPVTSLDDPARVINAIGAIRSGGGTDILAGIQAMAQVLPDEPSRVKHVILLTDGGADPTGIPELVSRLNQEDGITLTTVGVGRDAAPFLEQLAQLGGGRYHFTADPASIPSIFTEETTLATRAYLIEEPFTPELAGDSPILAGIDQFPPLYGYVGASPKAAAQTILVSPRGDPLLAAWQYGLGKAVAFTSDAAGRWAKDWLSWEGFPRFWAQAVRFTIGAGSQSPLEIEVEPGAGAAGAETARLVVNAYRLGEETPGSRPSGPYLNDYRMQARLAGPDGTLTEVELRQVAPGRYEGDFTPAAPGAYLIRVTGAPPGGGESVSGTAGWVLSYSPEYRQLEADPDQLARIAAAAGGDFAPPDPGRVFSHTLAAPGAARPAWPWLLALAALLLPLDVAVRRLAIARSDLARGWQKITTLLSRRAATVPARPVHDRRMETLLQAKGRRQEARPETVKTPPPAPPITPKTPEQPAGPAENQPAPPQAPGAPPPEAEQPRPSTAAALLEHKRRRQGKGQS